MIKGTFPTKLPFSNDLGRDLKNESQATSFAGHSWKVKFDKAFAHNFHFTHQDLANILNLNINCKRINTAIKSDGANGLRPDEQRRLLEI